MTLERTIAKHLLDIEAVALRPNDYFTWTSGIKSPIYCDNRITMSYPKIRREIAAGMSKVIKEKFPEVEVVAGTATAGIPHAAWVSEVLDLPMIYVRDSAKKHGKTNQIEGRLLEGQKVVIIEDLISTGLSSLKVAKALEEAAKQVAELEKAEKTGKDKDVITAGKGGVQLNNVGWAENPDQAVNKDQLDQTVNKSGFFVKNNGNNVATKDSTGKEISPEDKVTPNDVVNFKGDGIAKVNVETVRDDKGIDTTTITVGVDTSKLDLSNAAEYKAEENTGITVKTTAPQNDYYCRE